MSTWSGGVKSVKLSIHEVTEVKDCDIIKQHRKKQALNTPKIDKTAGWLQILQHKVPSLGSVQHMVRSAVGTESRTTLRQCANQCSSSSQTAVVENNT